MSNRAMPKICVHWTVNNSDQPSGSCCRQTIKLKKSRQAGDDEMKESGCKAKLPKISNVNSNNTWTSVIE
jgi:hypothetical protein